MTLQPGTHFGTYEIIAHVASGGMGEIYRAHDPRLNRDVAIKVLPEKTESNREAVARFQREAQAASALNHPHILTIYEIGSTPRDYIAMEFIDGETLRDRIERGGEIEETLDLLIQIGDALARAHEANIVHRDLKPDNIMVTKSGYAKVLDFGLAKLAFGDDSSRSPTEALTAARGLVGTIGYIAPEQIAGEAATSRSDIFAFGCVAYEAMARRRAFQGRNTAETLQQILTADPPPLRSVRPETPQDFQRLVSRCLSKKPELRYASMREVVADLRRLRDSLHHAAPRAMPRMIQLTSDAAIEHFPAISADGARIVFSREVGKIRKLFLKTIADENEEQLTDGPFDDFQASWSPAGDAILFVRANQPDTPTEPSDVFGRYLGGDIWMVNLQERKPVMVIRDGYNPAWSPDGARIAFDASWSGPRRIWIADGRGRNPQQVTTDATDAEHHVRPRWSPDGRHLVFQRLQGTKMDIRAIDVESRRMHSVTDDYTTDAFPAWAADGQSIVLTSYRSGGLNLWRIPVDSGGNPIGAMEQLTAGAGQDVEADVALRSGRIVFSVLRQNAEIWRLPIDPATGGATGEPKPIIAGTRENSRGAWSPDGQRIAFNSDRAGAMNLWLWSEGKSHQLTRGSGGDFQPSWSPDGNALVFFSGRGGATDIWKLNLKTEELTRLTNGEGLNINPFFSPDGQRIAFQSDRDGRLEVWSMNADGSDVRQLTTVGVIGHFLRWTPNSQQVYFRCPTGPKARTMLVAADGGSLEETANVIGGAHMSLSPDQSMMLDVLGHRELWLSPLCNGSPRKIFQFTDDARIDYPVWSPDGRWVLFDRFAPKGGDVWMIEES